MKALLPLLAGVLLLLGLAPMTANPPLADDDDDGKAVFLDQGCDRCHGVPAAALVAKPKKAEDTVTPLDKLGVKYERKALREFFKRPNTAEVKSHKKEFKGSDEELQALVDWLLEQKSE